MDEAELQRLRDENIELKAQLRRLKTGYVHLDQRLQRVEASIVFQFLRWFGRQLLRVGVPLPKTVAVSSLSRERADEEYRAWFQESQFYQRLAEQYSPALDHQLVSILLDARKLDQAQLESLTKQEHKQWELLMYSDAQPPPMEGHLAGHQVRTLIRENLADALREAVNQCRGAAVALLEPGAILEANAVRQWLAALKPEIAAAYSDWDHVDDAGRAHTPQFTPEFSPELLRQIPYWGGCYMIRTEALQKLSWPQNASGSHSAHDLGLRLAESFPAICRIPRVLWHRQSSSNGTREAETARPLIPHTQKRASIISCSRNPAQLTKFLKALKPVIERGHEVIVVAHNASGKSSDLEKIAVERGARAVAYEGPFHFGVMNKLGVDASNGEMLFLLNDDVYPTDGAGWLDAMMTQALRSDVGVVGALLLYPDGTIQHAGVAVGGWHHPAHIGRAQESSPYWPWLRITREVTAVTGACMALRREVWDELGGFDLRFPVNYNDVDLCLRAGERGYCVLLEARAVLIHEESRTRIPNVRAEDADRLHKRWGHVLNAPDKFFNPQFDTEDDSIRLPAPWTLVR